MLTIARDEWNRIRKESRVQVKDVIIDLLDREFGLKRNKDYSFRLHNRVKAGFIEIDFLHPVGNVNQIQKRVLRSLNSGICCTSYKGEIVEFFTLDLFMHDSLGRPVRNS